MLKFILLCIVCSSCSLFKGVNVADRSISINKDSRLILKDKVQEVKKDEQVTMPKNSFVVRAEGNVPVYVVPLNSEFETLDISLQEFTGQELTKTYRNEINNSLSKSLFDIHDIQGSIFQKQYGVALNKIEKAQKKYGKLDYLNYMRASVYFLQGKKSLAKSELQSIKNKENEKVQTFLREIK